MAAGSSRLSEYMIVWTNYFISPEQSNPVPVNPALQVQVKSPFCILSLIQSAFMSQGPERQGSGSVCFVIDLITKLAVT